MILLPVMLLGKAPPAAATGEGCLVGEVALDIAVQIGGRKEGSTDGPSTEFGELRYVYLEVCRIGCQRMSGQVQASINTQEEIDPPMYVVGMGFSAANKKSWRWLIRLKITALSIYVDFVVCVGALFSAVFLKAGLNG